MLYLSVILQTKISALFSMFNLFIFISISSTVDSSVSEISVHIARTGAKLTVADSQFNHTCSDENVYRAKGVVGGRLEIEGGLQLFSLLIQVVNDVLH